MVLLVGDVASDCRDREAFQEVNYFSFFGPLAKRVERIDDASRIPEYIARAFATAMNGRPGPVVLVLPEDMLTQTVAARPLPRVEPAQAWSDPGALRTLRQLLLAAQRPLVLAGGGGWTPQAAQALQRFAENWQLPVANAFRFQDTFDNHHPQYAGDVGLGINPALAARVRQSDLIIAIGPRLGEATTAGYTLIQAPVAAQKLVHIHASAEELNRVYQPTLAICATMNAAARSLEVLTAPKDVPWADWTAAAHADYLANIDPANGGITLPGNVDMPQLMAVLRQHLPADAVLTNGAGNFASWLHRFYPYHGLAKGHKTQLAPTNGAMGFGVPAGVAAAITCPERVAFTIAGDGDFLMNGQELATASQHGAKTIVLLVNNGTYGTIRMHQEREYPTRISGSALSNPDFCGLARAYGYAAERVTATAEFEPALLRALAAPTGTVIEVLLDPDVITTRGTLSAITQKALQGG
jgi:acetolactate synthase-1/2/3 large subunit